jgi:putative ABC transport system permease protein
MLNILRQLVRDTQSQKLRTLLTLFGIVWGTAAVSLLLAFGEGLQQQLLKSSAGIGDSVVIGWPGRTSKPFEGLGKGRRIQLDDDDISLIRQKAWGLGAISGEYMKDFKLQYGPKVLTVSVSGVDPDFERIRNLIPDAGGRFINALDQDQRRRAAFIGDELAQQVFGGTPPVGQVIQLQGSPFQVIGVLKKKIQNSSYTGRDNGRVIIPASTFREMTGQRYVSNVVYMAADVTGTDALKKEVLRVLAGKHRFDPTDTEALGMWDTTQSARFLHTFMLAFRIFLGVIGGLTMVVGGIGVSNIMNVVVEERTREIGIKMALGAKPRSILGQLIMETLVLTVVGGIIGILITQVICAVFPAFNLTEYVGVPRVSPQAAAVTAGLLGLIGFISGYFPARTASNLDPVVAMKL